jgi:hypothetical protein
MLGMPLNRTEMPLGLVGFEGGRGEVAYHSVGASWEAGNGLTK